MSREAIITATSGLNGRSIRDARSFFDFYIGNSINLSSNSISDQGVRIGLRCVFRPD
jgi:hypothetical protein